MSRPSSSTPWFDYPRFQWQQHHAIVIGGGIAGCQCAWHLLQTGWRVTLIERHHALATEASGNKAGAILPKMTAQPSLGEDFYTQSFNYTLQQLARLETSGETVDWHACGVIQLAHNPREEKRWAALKLRNFEPHFLQCLDEVDTHQTSGINTPYKSTYFPHGGWINPASFCTALTDHENCHIVLHSEALQLQQEQDQWQALNANNNLLARAEVIVIANGKDLQHISQSKNLPIMPVLGQTTQAKASATSAQLNTVIGHEGYLTPTINGQHIFGATFERNKYQAIISPQADAINQQQLHTYLPEFSDSLNHIKSSHAAIRMTSPDRFPYAGALIDESHYQADYADLHQGKHWKQYPNARYQKGLFILAGLGSRGLTTSGFCASLLSDIINGKQPQGRFIHALHPGRFMVKRLKTNRV